MRSEKKSQKKNSLFADSFFPLLPSELPLSLKPCFPALLHSRAPARGKQGRAAAPLALWAPWTCLRWWEPQPTSSLAQKLLARIQIPALLHLKHLFSVLIWQAWLPRYPRAVDRTSQQNAPGPTSLPILLRTSTSKHMRINPLLLFTLN